MIWCRMTALLTWNGVPPQVIRSISRAERKNIVSFGEIDRDQWFGWRNDYPEAIQKFAQTTAAVAESFTAWGAEVLDSPESYIGFHSKQLRRGGTTFQGVVDTMVHEDELFGLQKLAEKDQLRVRLLLVSTTGADFADLTNLENLQKIHETFRKDGTREFDRQLLTLAEEQGRLVRHRPWQILLFDASTPHGPRAVKKSLRRELVDAWIHMQLPQNWRERIASGDVPKLKLSALNR